MKLTSTAFADGEKMPQEFAKLGANHIPPLEIDGVPEVQRVLRLSCTIRMRRFPADFIIGRCGTFRRKQRRSEKVMYHRMPSKAKQAGVRAATTDLNRRSGRTTIFFISMRSI